jgi:hypothetical protein
MNEENQERYQINKIIHCAMKFFSLNRENIHKCLKKQKLIIEIKIYQFNEHFHHKINTKNLKTIFDIQKQIYRIFQQIVFLRNKIID